MFFFTRRDQISANRHHTLQFKYLVCRLPYIWKCSRIYIIIGHMNNFQFAEF